MSNIKITLDKQEIANVIFGYVEQNYPALFPTNLNIKTEYGKITDCIVTCISKNK